MQTPSELANTFYDTRFEKVTDENFIEWCNKCQKETKQTEIIGHDGLDSYSYCVCSECGNRG